MLGMLGIVLKGNRMDNNIELKLRLLVYATVTLILCKGLKVYVKKLIIIFKSPFNTYMWMPYIYVCCLHSTVIMHFVICIYMFGHVASCCPTSRCLAIHACKAPFIQGCPPIGNGTQLGGCQYHPALSPLHRSHAPPGGYVLHFQGHAGQPIGSTKRQGIGC